MDAKVLAAIFDVLPEPALVVRADGAAHRIVLANAAARVSYPLGDGEPLLPSVIRRPEVLDLVAASLIEGSSGEASWDSGAAQDRHLQATSRPLPTTAEGAPLALLIVRDETDARRNERMRADFLANASHELKTPLASLTGFIETLRGHARDDPKAREKFLGVMAGQAERMSQLVSDLMSLSRIELNEHIPPSGYVDLAGCARDVADALSPLLRTADVRIEISGVSAAPLIGDHNQVMQVSQNLIENAVKYSPTSGVVRVEILSELTAMQAETARGKTTGSRALLSPGNSSSVHYVAIRVSDEGRGITREQLPRLTERFYRAPGQTNETPGTGLGLAIVKHIINRHRGGLFVESAPDEGASFTAYFPQA